MLVSTTLCPIFVLDQIFILWAYSLYAQFYVPDTKKSGLCKVYQKGTYVSVFVILQSNWQRYV